MAPKLAVFTSRYANAGLAASAFVRVGITRYPPRFPLGYELKVNLVVLAPSAAMLTQARAGRLSARAFKAQYVRQIEKLGVGNVVKALRQLQGSAPGIVLLCYEDVHAGERCHRRYLADWLKVRACLDVPELPDLGGPPARSRPSKRRPQQLQLHLSPEAP